MFIPSGMEMETTAQIYAISLSGSRDKAAEKLIGIAIRRKKHNVYIFKSVKVSLRLMEETAIPVSSIAIGDIQLPAAFTAFIKNAGIGICKSPIAIPISMPQNIGLTRFLILSLKVGFSLIGINNAGIAQRKFTIHKGKVKIMYSKKMSGNSPSITAFPIKPQLDIARP